jgi:hypothetical protein
VSDPYQNYPQDPNYQPTQADTSGYQPTEQPYYQQQQPYQQPQQPYQQYQQPYQQPGYPQQMPMMGQPAKKKFPVWAIVTIVVVLVVCCGGGTIAGILAYNSDDKPNTPTATTTNGPVTTDTNGPGGSTGGDGGPTGAPTGGGDNTQDMHLGDSITVTDDDGSTMSVTVNSVKYRTTGCDTGEFNLSDPKKGDAYIVIDVTYNVTSGKGSYNPFDWSAVDKDGNESSDIAIFADCKPELGSSNALHGKRHGLVVLEVKSGVTHGQVIYSTALGDDSASWDF